jgi:hypothetical protein
VTGRWEHGSDFHLLPIGGREGRPPLPERQLHASGRSALLTLLEHLRREGLRRLFLPAYYCHDVTRAVAAAGFDVRLYAAGPFERRFELPSAVGTGDAVVIVNYFGLLDESPLAAIPEGAVAIEDHSHDPFSSWALGSSAAWCFASLRKTLPLPDGGALWSPGAGVLPEAPRESEQHAKHALARLQGMVMKARYLGGAPVDKEAFRELYIASEAGMTESRGAALSSWSAALLQAMPFAEWRELRRANHSVFAVAMAGCPGVRVAAAGRTGSAAPVAVIIVFDDAAARMRVRQALIERSIYPAVLWPLVEESVDLIPQDLIALSERLLALHCDMRYTAADMRTVAFHVREAMGG